MVASVKKDTMVIVLTGKYKGKKGRVIAVFPKKSKVKVEGVAIQTKHVKARKAGQESGIRKEEGLVHISNVKPVK